MNWIEFFYNSKNEPTLEARAPREGRDGQKQPCNTKSYKKWTQTSHDHKRNPEHSCDRKLVTEPDIEKQNLDTRVTQAYGTVDCEIEHGSTSMLVTEQKARWCLRMNGRVVTTYAEIYLYLA